MVQIVGAESFREGIVFVRLVVNGVAEIPQNILRRLPRLKKLLASRKPSRELRHMSPPCLKPCERRTVESAHAAAWRDGVGSRCMRIALKGEMRHAARKMPVGGILELLEVLVPPDAPAGECLCTDASLSVDMGGRCAWPHGLEGIRPNAAFVFHGMRMPELAHRRIRIFPVFKKIARDNIAKRCLVVHCQSRFMRKFGHAPVVVLRDEVAVRAPPVRQELFRRFRRFDHIAKERGQMSAQLVAVGGPEILFHPFRPRLAEALPAIDEHPVHVPFERAVKKPPDVALEIRLYAFGVELVALPTRRFLRCRGIDAFRVHMAEPQNRPTVWRRDPVSITGYVNGLCTVNPSPLVLHRRTLPQERTQHFPRLCLPIGLPRRCKELGLAPFRDREIVLKTVSPHCPRVLVARERQGMDIIPPIRYRQRRTQDLHPSARRLDLQADAAPRRMVAVIGIQVVKTRQRHGSYRHRLGERIDALVAVRLHAGRVRCPQRAAFIAQRSRKGQYADVAPVGFTIAKLLRNLWQAQPFAARKVTPRTFYVAHAMVEVDPRTAGLRPARAVLDGERQVKSLALVAEKADDFIPLAAHAWNLLRAFRPRTAAFNVEEVYAGQPRFLDGFKVAAKTVLPNVPAHELQPRLRPVRNR